MGDIGAIEPFALLNERFRPDHLFGWAQPHGKIEDRVRGSMPKPVVVDVCHAVA
ncbi:MAG TPA: hypothetical protein VGQ62_01170 [Chloroflexota bacterium]|nr:hypothetical protein [Chloroflexota bacterium]